MTQETSENIFEKENSAMSNLKIVCKLLVLFAVACLTMSWVRMDFDWIFNNSGDRASVVFITLMAYFLSVPIQAIERMK